MIVQTSYLYIVFLLPIVTVEAGQKDPLQRPATVIGVEHQWLKDRHDMKRSWFDISTSKILVHVHGLDKRTNERRKTSNLWHVKNLLSLVYHQGMERRWYNFKVFWDSRARSSIPKKHHKWCEAVWRDFNISITLLQRRHHGNGRLRDYFIGWKDEAGPTCPDFFWFLMVSDNVCYVCHVCHEAKRSNCCNMA